MKRSTINAIILDADQFIRKHCFCLPPFAYWTPADWERQGGKINGIVETNLGWDITDFGSGVFQKNGLTLFTLRNGNPENLVNCSGKIYAEKILVINDGQKTPMHFHWKKTEDIINRNGGVLALQLFNATENEDLDQTGDVIVNINSMATRLPAGEIVRLKPGESITLEPRCYHSFWGEGKVLAGEVSSINDDASDNRFLKNIGRFPKIIEDEPPIYLLTMDYKNLFS